jgi:cytoskeleton protein RodZ
MSGTELKVPASDAGPGGVLAAAREELGVSQREVAEALNLPINVVDAIEVGDNSRLPSHVFTRGYVRAYAKLLELDADPLVAALVLEHEEHVVPPSAPRKRLDLSALRTMNPQILLGAGAAAVVIFILIVIGVFASGGDEPEEQGQQPAEQVSAEQLPASEATSDLLIAGAEVTTARPATAQGTQAQPTDPQTTTDGRVAAMAATQVSLDQGDVDPALETAATAALAPGVRRLTPEGDDRLSFLFAEDCWVSIKGTQGKVLFGDLGKAGQTLEFVGTAPFTVLLGYAQGVILKYNSEPIALAPHTRNNVATLVLGQ